MGLIDGVGFAAIADEDSRSGGSGGLLFTAIFAGICVTCFEYIAVNRDPPIPDPLFSGFYLTIHSVVRTASKYTDIATQTLFKPVGGVMRTLKQQPRGGES